MIISHKYKFIFIKTQKTAGTSLEIALAKFLGPDDVVTRIGRNYENMRQELGYQGPRNFVIPYSRYLPRDWAQLLIKRKRPVYYNHIAGCRVRHYVGEECWKSYFKFCFERNPWDKVISYYYWRNKKEPYPPLQEWLLPRRLRKLQRTGGAALYAPAGEIILDEVYRFEEMEAALSEIERRLGLPGKLEMPRARAGFRKDKRDARALLDPESLRNIAEIFKSEFSLLGYDNRIGRYDLSSL